MGKMSNQAKRLLYCMRENAVPTTRSKMCHSHPLICTTLNEVVSYPYLLPLGLLHGKGTASNPLIYMANWSLDANLLSVSTQQQIPKVGR